MPSRKTICFWLILVLAIPVLALCLMMGSTGVGMPGQGAILQLRLARVIAGFVIGAGLSCSGVVLQALLRNPLAEPYVLGVSSGAGLGAAIAILSGLWAVGVFALPLTAFVCACITLALVYLLAADGGKPSLYGLILSGVIISSICSSLLMFLVAFAPMEGLHSIMWWMLGNLQAPEPALLIACSALVLFGFLLLWALSAELNALTLGTDMAHHLGVRTDVVVVLGLVLATLVTAASVALAGLIGFVGLIVPHALRALIGPDHRRLLPASILGGGMFLAVCDAVARTALAPREIPVGVITALIGGPFFLFVLRHRRRQGWIE